MARIKRAHVQIRVVDRDGSSRRYECLSDYSTIQLQIEKECGHQSAASMTCFGDCLGYVDLDEPPDVGSD